MKRILTSAAALFLLSSTARADTPKKSDHESATGAVHEALDEKAEAPKATGSLPEEASQTAQNRSHGKQGMKMKALHSESRETDRADKDAKGDAEKSGDVEAAREDAANQSARGASESASKDANGDAHNAAGQARASEKRGGQTPGSNPHRGH